MELPSANDLDDMAELVGGAGVTFASLGPEARIQVIQLVNQCDLLTEVANVSTRLSDLDHELTKVGEWFKYSKTYEGR